MSEAKFPEPGDWDYEDPSDSSCGRYCHPDGCADNHPTFTYQIIGPDWADDDWGSARCVSKQHAALMASAPDLYAALVDACEEIAALRHYANNNGGMIDEEKFVEGLAALAKARASQ